jgi:hypothetical protein
MASDAGLQTYITDEISRKLSGPKMTWKKLDMCFKWMLLRDYLSVRKIPDNDKRSNHVRDLLRGGFLQCVEYNNGECKVVRINKADDPSCVDIDDMPLTT